MQLAAQRQQELLNAYAKLAPAVSATSSYTRNQYQVEVNIPVFAGGMPTGMSSTAVITPQDQVDAVFSLSVPLIDAGAWQRIGAARSTAQAAKERAGATGLEVQKNVARTYFLRLGELFRKCLVLIASDGFHLTLRHGFGLGLLHVDLVQGAFFRQLEAIKDVLAGQQSLLTRFVRHQATQHDVGSHSLTGRRTGLTHALQQLGRSSDHISLQISGGNSSLAMSGHDLVTRMRLV